MGTYCVTGAASGIGAATKAVLEAGGHRVIGVDLRNADVEADMATPQGRQSAIDAVLAHCGGSLDGFVPCAGVNGVDSSEPTVRINFFGVMAMVAGLRSALTAAKGSMVLISSNSTIMTPGLDPADAHVFLAGDEDAAVAHFTPKGWLAYPSGKLAIAYWVRMNAPAWMADGVRINAVAPGVIDTGMTRPLLDDEMMKNALAQIPIPANRWGRPEEIAGIIEFLLSDKAAYIVGQTIIADGGTDVVLQPTSHPHPLPG